MATYYKYAERNASTDVNWAEIGKNLTDTLKKEAEVREEKKAAIDEASRLYGETLANAPTGESRDMNEWALKFASDAQKARLLQDRLLKSGQLKLKDYTIMRQNLTDGTKTAFSLSEEYQKEYKEKMDRAKAGENQALEEFYMAQAEGFANFKNTNLYINPTNYQVSVGKMYKDKDGVYKMSENPNDFFTVNELRNRMKDKFDYFDYDKALNGWVKNLGKYSEVINAAGGWKVISDPLLRDKLDPKTKQSVNEMMLAMDNQLKSYIFANPYNGTSLLTEDIGVIDGKAVDFTFDPAEAAKNKNLVLLNKDPNNPNGPAIPEFSKEQQDIMLNFMKTQATVKLEHTETYTQKQQRMFDINYAKYRDAKKEEEGSFNVWNTVFSGATDAEKQAAVETILGMQRNIDAGLVDISFSDGIVKLIYDEPKKNREMKFSDNTTLLQWAQFGNELTGVDDAATVFKKSGGGDPNSKIQNKDLLINIKSTRGTGKSSTKQEDPVVQYNTMVDMAFPEPVSGEKIEGILFDPNNNESAVVASLQAQFGAYGFDFEGTGTVNDYVTVFALNDKGDRITNKKIEVPVNNAKGASQSPKKLRDFIKANTTLGKKQEASMTGVTGGGIMSGY